MREGNVGRGASRAPWSESVDDTAQGGAARVQSRLAELESLESRTLLTTIPAPPPSTAAGLRQTCRTWWATWAARGPAEQRAVAIDPTNPTKMVTVSIDNDPAMATATLGEFQIVLEAAYSINGGQKQYAAA